MRDVSTKHPLFRCDQSYSASDQSITVEGQHLHCVEGDDLSAERVSDDGPSHVASELDLAAIEEEEKKRMRRERPRIADQFARDTYPSLAGEWWQMARGRASALRTR